MKMTEIMTWNKSSAASNICRGKEDLRWMGPSTMLSSLTVHMSCKWDMFTTGIGVIGMSIRMARLLSVKAVVRVAHRVGVELGKREVVIFSGGEWC